MGIRYALLLCAAANLGAADPPLGVQVRDGLLKLIDNGRVQGSYLFSADHEEKKFNSGGSVKTSDSRRVRFEVFEGERAGFVVARNGMAVGEGERKTQEERIRKAREERKNLSAVELAKRRKDREKRQKDQTGFMAEFAEAFDFKLLGKETLKGRPTLVVAFTPRASYKPGSLRARLFVKARGKAWIDEQDRQLAKFEGEIFDDMSLGGVLANVGTGSGFEARQVRVGPGEWIAEYEHSHFTGRLLLLKSFREEETSTYSGFTRIPGK